MSLAATVGSSLSAVALEIPLAHSGELHAGDLIIVAPLLLLVLLGVVMLARGARSAAEEPDENREPTGRDE